MAMMVLVILAALAAAVLAVGTSEVNISANLLRGSQALYLAESGIEAAFMAIYTTPTLLSSATSTPASLSVASPGTTLAAYGTYAVQYRTIGSNTVEVVSQGTTANGAAKRTIRATMTTNFNSNDAVRSKKDITVSGSVQVNGSCGSVHSNEDLSIAGSGVMVAENATATLTYSDAGHPTIGGVSGGGKAAKDVPTVSTTTYLTAAETQLKSTGGFTIYKLLSDGKVQQSTVSGSTVTYSTVVTLANNGSWSGGWSYKAPAGSNPAQWTMNNTSGLATGAFYVEGEAKITSSPGTLASPWNATIISTSDLDVSGSPTMSSVVSDTVFVSGGNLDMSGSPTVKDGIIAVAGTTDISGNPSITGYVLSNDAVTLRGSITITFNCGLNPPLTGALSFLSWGY